MIRAACTPCPLLMVVMKTLHESDGDRKNTKRFFFNSKLSSVGFFFFFFENVEKCFAVGGELEETVGLPETQVFFLGLTRMSNGAI